MTIQFTTTEHDDYTLLEFEIPGGVCEPSDLATLNPPEVDGTGGVVISGRGPVWLYAALAHHYHTTQWVATFDKLEHSDAVVHVGHYHTTQWVATFDPRMGGAVVTSRHSRTAPPVGAVVEIPKMQPA